MDKGYEGSHNTYRCISDSCRQRHAAGSAFVLPLLTLLPHEETAESACCHRRLHTMAVKESCDHVCFRELERVMTQQLPIAAQSFLHHCLLTSQHCSKRL